MARVIKQTQQDTAAANLELVKGMSTEFSKTLKEVLGPAAGSAGGSAAFLSDEAANVRTEMLEFKEEIKGDVGELKQTVESLKTALGDIQSAVMGALKK